MSVKVKIPNVLVKLTQGEKEVHITGQTIRELIDNLEEAYPGIRERICDENENIRRFINVFVNEENIRFLEGDKTPVKDGDEVSIIPAIAGGACPVSQGQLFERNEEYGQIN